MQRLPTTIKKYSRQLRRDMTDAEKHLWRYLRMRQIHGIKFRRQHPVGSYILDFACLDKKIALELDGSQHFDNVEYDNARTAWLESQGWRVLRFWNNDVLLNVTGVLEQVDGVLRCNSTPTPTLPLIGGGSTT